MGFVRFIISLTFLSLVSAYWQTTEQMTTESVTGTANYNSQGMTTVSYGSTSRGGRMEIPQGTSFRLDGHRLEVYHNGRWGTVCDDGFTQETSRDICKIIYGQWPSYSNFYSQSNGIVPSVSTYLNQIWLDQLECRNTLYSGVHCSANNWGINDCSHTEDVFIECQFSDNYEMTTVNYDTSSQGGRMDIQCGTGDLYISGTIESPNFSGHRSNPVNCTWNLYVKAGRVVLLDMQMAYLLSWPSYITFYDGVNSTNILFRMTASTVVPYKLVSTSNTMRIEFYSDRPGRSNRFRATFNEIDRIEMTTSSFKVSSEGGRMTIAQGTKFRLDRGRLEVNHNGRWGTVCDDGFDSNTALGLCYRLYGEWPYDARYYNQQYSAVQGSYLPVYPILLDQLECRASYYNNNYHADCSANYWGDHDCTHNEDVYIDCVYPNQGMTTVSYDSSSRGGRMEIPQGTSFRLDGNRLEVYHNGRWGTVCDDGFTATTSRDICKLIYGKWPSSSRYYSQYNAAVSTVATTHLNQIWLDELVCTNSFYNGVQCSANTWGINDCSHDEDVFIECRFQDYYEQTTEYNTATYMISAAPHYTSDMYVSSITVGCDPAAWNIMIYLPDLYKRHSDFDPSDIYLGRPGCQGYRVGNYLRIDQQYSNCDTHHFMTPDKVEYTNTLVYAYRDANYKFIIRDYRFRIDVHCDMSRRETVSQHFIQTHNNVRMRSSNPHVYNTGHYNIRMSFYRDSSYQNQMYGNPLMVNIGEDIYVSVTTPLSDYEVKVRVESCYTLPSPDAPDRLKFYLIKNGCASDVNTHITYGSSHENRFVFRDFEYSTNQDNLYLFCTAIFCNVTDYSSICDQSCHRTKRETVQSASEAHVIRSETSDVLKLSKGRSRRDIANQEDTETSGHTQYISADDHLFIAVIVSAVGISVIAVFVAIRRYRKPKSKLIDTI